MKVCMYSIDCVFGNGTGGIRRFQELLYSLKNVGHDVFLYSNDSTEAINNAGFIGHSISSQKSDNSKMIGLKSSFGKSGLFKEIKKHRFDRVVVFDVRAAFSLVINGIKNIYLFIRQDLYIYKKIQLDDSSTNRIKQFVLLQASKFAESLCLKKSAKIIVQCQFDLNNLISRHPCLKKKILLNSYVQINNINPSWVTKQNNDCNNDEKKYDICFIGNFRDYRKGHDLLLPAIKELTNEGNKIEIAVIGDGKHLDECKKMYAGDNNIHFLGRLNNPVSVLTSSKLLIVPSYADSCPNTVMEALYFKVPVIGSDRGGIPEILNYDEWIFEMNVESIKGAISHSLIPDNNKRILKEQQLRRKELMFDWGNIMVKIVEC